MLVYFVTDEPTKLPAIRAMLEPQHAVVPWVLGGDGTGIRSHGVLMVDIDLRQMARVDQVRFVMQELADIPEKLFVVHNLSRSMVAQAYALGATAVISRPKEAILKVAQIEEAETAEEDRRCRSGSGDGRRRGRLRLDVFECAPWQAAEACRCAACDVEDHHPRRAGRAFDMARRGASLSRGHVSALPACDRCCGRLWAGCRILRRRCLAARHGGDPPRHRQGAHPAVDPGQAGTPRPRGGGDHPAPSRDRI